MFDGMEDMYKYGMGMPMMGGMGMGGQRGQQQQKSRRLRMVKSNKQTKLNTFWHVFFILISYHRKIATVKLNI